MFKLGLIVLRYNISSKCRHLRDAHGNIDSLNESQFRMVKKRSTKWNCFVYDSLGPNSLFNFQCLLIYSSLHYNIFCFIVLFSLDNDLLETSKRRDMFYNNLTQNFYCQTFTKFLLIQILLTNKKSTKASIMPKLIKRATLTA